MLNTCFPSGSLQLWYLLGREYLHDYYPIKTLGSEMLMGTPGQKHRTCYCNFSLLEKEARLVCPVTGGRAHGEVCIWIYPDSTCVFYPCSSYHVSFHCNKPYPWDNYMLNPMRTSINRSLNVGVVLGLPETEYYSAIKRNHWGASLVVQWLRIHLPVQGTWVQALVREDPTCRGAAKPMWHNYWACALEPASHNYLAHVPQLLKSVYLEPVLRNKRSHHNEKPSHCNEE